MTVTITQNLADVAGVADNDTFIFRSPVTRLVGSTVIGTRPKRVTPVAGVLTVQLEPGPCTVSWNRGIDNVDITVPGTDSDLWSLIAAGIATPPNTSADALAAAIGAYMTAHPVSTDEYHEYANLAAFPGTGTTDRLYVAQDTGKLYRWNGSAYAQIADKASVGLGNADNTSDATKLASHLRRPLNNTCVAIGASITGWGDQYHYPPQLPGGYLHQLAIESMQRVRDGGTYATGGYTFAQIQSTHLPQVLALSPAPGACIIGECTNDIAGAVPFATTVGILKAMVASLLAAGIAPILTTLPPDDAHSTKAAMEKWNKWIRRYASQNGFPLLDSAVALTGLNGGYADASYTTDNLHPTDLGHRLICQQGLADGLVDVFPPNSAYLTSRSSVDVTNLFNSGSLNYGLFTTNTSGVGTGLTNVGTGGTASILAPDAGDNLMGNWQRIATSTGQSSRALLAFLSGWSAGDRLALSARVRARGFNGAGCYFDVQTQMARSSGTWSQGGSSVSTLVQGLNVVSADVEGLMYVEFDVYASTTSLRLQVDVGAVSGTGTPVLDVGELTVTNLTTGGLLA